MVKAMKLGPFQCAFEPVQAKGGGNHSDEGNAVYFKLTIAMLCMSVQQSSTEQQFSRH